MFKGKTLVEFSDQKVFNSDRDIYSWKESPALELCICEHIFIYGKSLQDLSLS